MPAALFLLKFTLKGDLKVPGVLLPKVMQLAKFCGVNTV